MLIYYEVKLFTQRGEKEGGEESVKDWGREGYEKRFGKLKKYN